MADNNKVKMVSGENVIEVSVERAEDLLTMNIRGGSGWKLADEGWESIDGRLTRKAKKENAKKEK